MKTFAEHTPKLAPPGAGLPWIELQVARLGFGWLKTRQSPQQIAARLDREEVEILELVGKSTPEENRKPVLIKRLRGLEDSSRFWSVFMVLDHLRIINLSIAGIVTSLAQGKVPPGKASTAAVKPSAQADAPVVEGFKKSCQRIRDAVDSIDQWTVSARFEHPWFGPLSAAEWYFMAAFHLGLHRQQIEKIQLGLASMNSRGFNQGPGLSASSGGSAERG